VTETYDTIGTSYNTTRCADPRIERVIWSALGDSRTVLNVGAGTGAYEPPDRAIVAVEPSATMRAARPPGAAPCLAARAEALPLDDASIDAAMAILTIHHWGDYRAGLRELRRVARHRVLILHWDQAVVDQLWLADYFPEAFDFDRHRGPALGDVRAGLGLDTEVIPLLVPHDCRDGFAAAFWRRPQAYLDPVVRAGMSMLAQTERQRGDGLDRLQRDLADGTWAARHHALLSQPEHDCGYRLLIGTA
jgi:SAM-dependent methyltransferase